jgi:uracil DNA glycosylase
VNTGFFFKEIRIVSEMSMKCRTKQCFKWNIFEDFQTAVIPVLLLSKGDSAIKGLLLWGNQADTFFSLLQNQKIYI